MRRKGLFEGCLAEKEDGKDGKEGREVFSLSVKMSARLSARLMVYSS